MEARPINRPATGSKAIVGSVLDVHATAALDRLTRWASKALRARVAIVSLVHGDDLVVTSMTGAAADAAGAAELSARVVADRAPLQTGPGDQIAFVGAPLIDSTGRVLGCLCAIDPAPRTWSEHETALATELSISATTELELHTARAMAEREARWNDGRQDVLELIAARAPLHETLTRLLRVAEAHATGMLASILLVEPGPHGRDVLRHAAAPSLPRSFTDAIDGLAVGDGQGICGTAAFRREPVVVLDVATDPLTAAFVDLADEHGLRAGWSTPILSSAGDVLGTFAIYYGGDRRPKPSDEIVIDRSIHLARLAIEHNHDAEALRRSASEARALAREQTALQRVATSVASETNPSILFARVAQQTGTLLGAESGYVVRFEGDDEFRPMGSWGSKGATTLPIGEVFAQAPDGLCADLRGGRSARRRTVEPGTHLITARHRIGAPIVVDGRTWGMVVAVRDRPGPFPREDEKRIARFAQLASVAVANAHARERLAAQALTDPLTGLANRRAFDQRLAEETERAVRHGRELSLMLVDVDHFKAINDRFGHSAGDRVLVNLARDMHAVMRHGDLLARIGGDEMAMILADCAPDQAEDVARRMLDAVVQDDSLSKRHGVTLSIGVAGLAAGRSAGDLLRLADQALYSAKDAGRNRVVSDVPKVTSRPPI